MFTLHVYFSATGRQAKHKHKQINLLPLATQFLF